MKKTELNKIASDFFASNKGVDKIFVSSDGLVFINENAAKLHKNTNKSDKKLTLKEYTTGVVASSTDETKQDGVVYPLTEKDVKKIKLEDLQKMAEDLKVDLTDLDTKQKIADALNELAAKA